MTCMIAIQHYFGQSSCMWGGGSEDSVFQGFPFNYHSHHIFIDFSIDAEVLH